MKMRPRQMIQLTLLSLALVMAGCGAGNDKPGRSPTATSDTANLSEKSSSPTASKESQGPVPKAEAPQLVKSQEQPVIAGSGQTFQGNLRTRLSMPRKSAYIDWSPDGKWLLVDGPELWSVDTGKPVRKFDPAAFALFHPHGTQVIGGDSNSVFIWDLASGTVVKKIPTEIDIDQIACSADGNRLLVRQQFANFGVCDVEQAVSRTLNRTTLGINCFCGAISPDGKTLAMSGDQGKMVLIDADTFAVKSTRDAHQGEIDQIVFSHDGKLLATCCDEEKDQHDKVIRIWNAATGEQLNQYVCDDSNAQQLKFSPGDTRLLSAGRHLYVDDPLGQGTAKTMLDRTAALVNDAVFSPDADRVAAVTNTDQDIHLFDLVKTGSK